MSLIGIIFIFINLLIIKSDINKKIIPNKLLLYLLLLLPLYYITLPFYFNEPLTLAFLIQIFVSFLVTFGLFYYGIWGAGDAKYLLVLSLFLPHIGIIPFISNIALLTLTYLGIYFIYFYMKKLILTIKQRKLGLGKFVFTDLKHRYQLKFYNQESNLVSATIKWLLQFLIIFFSLRLLKIYLFDSYILNNYESIVEKIPYLQLILDNPSYLFGSIILLVIIFYYIFSRLFHYLGKKINKFINYFIIQKYKINPKYTSDIGLGFICMIFIIGLFIEAMYNYEILIHNLWFILSYYLIFYIVIKILIYAYKLTFQEGEEEIINIKYLQEGDLVDKKFLVKNFEHEKCLGAYNNKSGIMYPSPKNYIFSMDNPITQKDVKTLQECYKVLNTFHNDKNNNKISPLKIIKILKTFAFGGYIFAGFFITFFYQDIIFKYIVDFIFQILKNLYS